MQRPRKFTSLLPYLLALWLGCGKCTPSPAQDLLAGRTSERGPSGPSAPESLHTGPPRDLDAGSNSPDWDSSVNSGWSLLIGEEDTDNRYPSTVSLAVRVAGSHSRRACTGVLMGSRLVLTAGYCVCIPSSEEGSEDSDNVLMAASLCEKTAMVMTHMYVPASGEDPAESFSRIYEGTIRPHPRLELLFDGKGNVISSKANLAVLLLDKPVKRNTPPVRIAEEEARIDETLTVVGFGPIEGDGLDGQRRFTQEKVVSLLDPASGRFLFGEPDLHAYRGDTGGPCLRETAQGPLLVGISNRGSEEEPTFTSLNPYRDWLREEIQHAETTDSPLPR